MNAVESPSRLARALSAVSSFSVVVRRRPSRLWSRMPRFGRYAVILAIVLGAWEAAVRISGVSSFLIVGPSGFVHALLADTLDGTLPRATAATMSNLLLGMLIGAVLGFVFASLAVFSRAAHDTLSVFTAILNPLPAIAMLPLAMLWFGLTTKAIVFVVALSAIWPIAINTDMGFRTLSPTVRMAARNLGLFGPRLVLEILLPAALPMILAGLRTSWSLGWRTVVAAELVFGVAGSAGGLGWYINESRYFMRTDAIFAGLVAISLLGVAIDVLFALVERRTIERWGMKVSAK